MKYLALCIALFAFTACTTILPIEMSPKEVQSLTNADKLALVDKTLLITKSDNSVIEAKVLGTTENSIVTNKGEYLYEDIQSMNVKKISKGKTAAAVGGASLATLVLGTFVIANAID